MSKKPRKCILYCPGLVPYQRAWDWQRSLVQHRRQRPDLDDVFILLEHSPVYTLGQGSQTGFLKFDPSESDVPVHRIERGGEVTYHAPGQIVGYPILNLRHYEQDLHWYLRQLEEVIIRVVGHYGLRGERIAGLTGVWVDHHKIAAIGIKVTRWITMHGFALNVCPEMSGFRQIVPCGISDRPVGSLEQFCPGVSVSDVQPLVLKEFASVFNVSLCLQSSLRLETITGCSDNLEHMGKHVGNQAD
ncbi:MAG: lipoyl(octanoyl) transferase LipB [Leptolyngbyaceae bacterium]|nr:lipoyl(octanoyl) transferase LipB [Leptolyngbyaceae bacterium]